MQDPSSIHDDLSVMKGKRIVDRKRYNSTSREDINTHITSPSIQRTHESTRKREMKTTAGFSKRSHNNVDVPGSVHDLGSCPMSSHSRSSYAINHISLSGPER